ncbi:proteasome component M29 [Teratosphaeriaceae sp. CCFEE 6253]|nr:proteasome component M29 [Teratosphaeriaceae sp. CCFEE 6253]
MHQTIFTILEPLLSDASDAEPMEVDGEANRQKDDELKESTLAAGVESLLASLNPAVSSGASLTQALSQALDVIASVSSPSASVRRSTYTALKQLSDRLRKKGKGEVLGANVETRLRPLLFGPDPGTEALRLLRADAIASVVETSPPLALAFGERIRALLVDEKSVQVRDRLAAATKR